MLNDPLAQTLSNVLNKEKRGQKEVVVTPVSKIIRRVLSLLQDNQYLGETQELTDARGGAIKINLLGKINMCGVVKPRFSVKLSDYEKFEKRYLPAKDVGVLIVSTPQGIMTHAESKEKRLGGKLLAYCY